MSDPVPTESGRPSQPASPSPQPATAAAGTPQASSQPPQRPLHASMPAQAHVQSPAGKSAGQPPTAAGAQPSVSAEAATSVPGDADAAAELQAEIATLRAKSGELADQYLRAKADAENARRRADEEISKARKFAVESFAESMLPVLDSLEAGLAIKDATVQQIQDGTNGTLQQLKAALERNKVLPIDPKPGEKFDPNQHHAIGVASAVPGQPAVAPNSVVTVLQKGYTIAERVLRPALVMVSAPS